MGEELKACPFCGGEAQSTLVQGRGIEWAQVECINRDCGAVGPTPATEAEAITAWNTRTDPDHIAAIRLAREALEALLDPEIAHVGPYAGQRVIAARTALTRLTTILGETDRG